MKDQKDFDLPQIVRSKLPNVRHIIGITTNCPIGCLNGEALEIENRPGVSFLLAPVIADIDVAVNYVSSDDLSNYSTRQKPSYRKSDANGISWVFSTDSEKNKVVPLIRRLQTEKNLEVLGAIASVVSGQRGGAVYVLSPTSTSKVLSGAVTAVIHGDIDACVLPSFFTRAVTSEWETISQQDTNILRLKDVETSEEKLPLEALDNVLSASPATLSVEDLDSLRRDLLVSVGGFGQRPSNLNPTKGSFSLAAAVDTSLRFNFAVKDTFLARASLKQVTQSLRYLLQDASTELDVKGVVCLGSGDRGVKMFRVRNYETSCISDEMNKHSTKIGGMHAGTVFFTDGLIVGNKAPKGDVIVTDTDHALVFLTSRFSANLREKLNSFLPPPTPPPASAFLSPLDQLTVQEKEKYDDSSLGVGGVLKKDPTASAPVKVGDLDFIVPDKLPLPGSYLESMVWDRDKDVDRGRERYPAARALLMAKKREVTAPVRSLSASVKELKGERKYPLMFIELMRTGIHYPPLPVSSTPESILSMAKQIQEMYLQGRFTNSDLKLGGLGCNVDGSNFLGSFADVDTLRTNNVPAAPLTLFCSDLVLYAYQLFRARAEGADWVKLQASFNTITELSYLAKTARTMKMESVVVVYSTIQALAVLHDVPEVQGICFSSRNINLWKVDKGKAERLLADVQVQEALKARKDKQPGFVVLQEAFSEPSEIFRAGEHGVDAVILGEELLSDRNGEDITEVLKRWMR
eukprot:gene28222-34080_t